MVMRGKRPGETRKKSMTQGKPTGSRVSNCRRRIRAKHLLLAVMGIGLLLSPAAIAETETGTQEVTAQVAHAIELIVPSSYDWGELIVGENESVFQAVTVKSTAPYDLKIRADRTNLAQYDLAVGHYVGGGRELQNPLQWKEAYSGGYSAISTVDMPVVIAAPPTGSAGTTTMIQFRQFVGYGDHALPDGMVYRIVLTYTAMNTV